ncbi:hypothetical protein HHI36_013685 [Cryptolaemus montrouzieri]|uniref:Tc1-like transposase DDE domain-containing protein n=1 Tax=Cryptolaemus montrouzieri TaxID=559131 RepID=A0ABD2NHX8_9CUCU
MFRWWDLNVSSLGPSDRKLNFHYCFGSVIDRVLKTENIVCIMSSTDTADESTVENYSSKNRPKKGHFTLNEKQIIFNVYNRQMQIDSAPINEIVEQVANIVGVSKTSVYRQEGKENHSFSQPRTYPKRVKIADSVTDFDKNLISRKVHQFFHRNELPTIDKILNEVNSDVDLPNFKRTTFRKILKKMDFRFQKRGRNGLLLEKEEIVLWRRDYLRQIKNYLEENRKIYYLDETWVNADASVKTAKQAFQVGFSTGLKNPTGKGKRLIVCNIGSDTGFVPDALWSFESKKSGDYHEEMDGPNFEEWFENILPKLEDGCVIVLDNASYHSRRTEKLPTSASKKATIQEWLR